MTFNQTSCLLSHYTSEPLEYIRPGIQSIEPSSYAKPNGFWVSVDGANDWTEWCERENFYLEQLRFQYRITLTQCNNILWLISPTEILNFTQEFNSSKFSGIDWTRVANKYDGIIIAPYQWSLRLDFRTEWYYGWDCASGCIWNPSAISNVELIDTRTL